MSVAFAEPVAARPTSVASGRPVTAPGRVRPVRPGPGTGPASAPRRLRFTAPAANATRAACSPVLPVVRAPQPRSRRSTWHLTERGLAVVLVLAAALVAASVAVVALTAVRVTGESYHPAQTTSAPVVLVQD